MIKIDTEDIEKLKTKIWRINGKEIIFYQLNSKNLKKISQISIECFLMNKNSTEILFKSKDKNDYRKNNFKICNEIKIKKIRER